MIKKVFYSYWKKVTVLAADEFQKLSRGWDVALRGCRIIGATSLFVGLYFLFVLILCPRVVYANFLFSFQGEIDFAEKELKVDFDIPDNGSITIEGSKDLDDKIQFLLGINDLKAFSVGITRNLQGSVWVVDRPKGLDPMMSGIIRDEEKDPKMMQSDTLNGKFEIRDDRIYFTPLSWNGLDCKGYFSFLPPYDMNLSLFLKDIALFDFLSWFDSSRDIHAEGEVSGQIKIFGFLDRLMIDGELSSYFGEIEDFKYDDIILGFEGTYPIVKLTRVNITEENGVSFDVEGAFDLSKDINYFKEQLESFEISPLIRETDVQREWIVRREKKGRREGETEFKYRLRRERGISGMDEPDMLSIERSIKF